MLRTLPILFGCLILASAKPVLAQADAPEVSLEIPYEKHTLDNGLEVILHEDHSDPIVSVAILFNVGSNREKPGRTGFAHFFEHMLFQASENVEKGAFFKEIEDLGGEFNGGTWQDGTVYYEVVPKDALERILWMESDRMGFMINTVTEPVLENEKEVVKNEKRQRVDNQPYGHQSYVVDKAMYPEGHPYNWQVIGSLDDLEAAEIADVKEFYDKWYGPNNATMVIAGDIDPDEVLERVEYYFSEIPARAEVEPLEPRLGELDATVSLMHEDNFAELPQLTMTWPVVQAGHPDEYPLDYLAELLTDGKRAPVYQVLTEERGLAPEPYAYNSSAQLAGQFVVVARATDGTDLDSVKAGIEEALARFEERGIDERDMERIRNTLETNFYNQLNSVLSKSFRLAEANEFYGSPEALKKQVAGLLGVTADDVMRVYREYIAGEPYVMTSFVPEGQPALAVEGAEVAEVVEEEVTDDDAGAEPMDETATDYPRTPSQIDRSVKPALVGEVVPVSPEIYTEDFDNGARLYGVESDELPLITYSIVFDGGALTDPEGQEGLSNILMDLLLEGTEDKTPEEFADAIGQLGANVFSGAGRETNWMYVTALARNFDASVELMMEAIMEPRFDEAEFERLKAQAVQRVQGQLAQPGYAAGQAFRKVLYGTDSRLSRPNDGTVESLRAITLQDVRDHHARYINPRVATVHVVGDVDDDAVEDAFESYEERWTGEPVELPTVDLAGGRDERLFFVDVPDAKQSVIYVGQRVPGTGDPDNYKLKVVNHRLGGYGGAELFLTLREEKGYTYGAYSQVTDTKQDEGAFVAYSNVRSNVTKESAELFREIVGDYGKGYDEEDLAVTQQAFTRKEALANESLRDKLTLLEDISKYDLDPDFKAERLRTLNAMTVDDAKALITKYMDEDGMRYIVVGDGATQLEGLGELGLGEPVLLDRQGEVLMP